MRTSLLAPIRSLAAWFRKTTDAPDPTIRISTHAIDRYRERVRPGLDRKATKHEIEHLIQVGEVTKMPPEWCGGDRDTSDGAFLLIGNDLVLPLRGEGEELTAVTCLVRGTISARERRRRRARKMNRKPPRRQGRGNRKGDPRIHELSPRTFDGDF